MHKTRLPITMQERKRTNRQTNTTVLHELLIFICKMMLQLHLYADTPMT